MASQIERWLVRHPIKRFDHQNTSLEQRRWAIKNPLFDDLDIDNLSLADDNLSDKSPGPSLPALRDNTVSSLRVRRKSKPDRTKRRSNSGVPGGSDELEKTSGSDGGDHHSGDEADTSVSDDADDDSDDSDDSDDENESSRPASISSTPPSSPPPRLPEKRRTSYKASR